MNEKLVQFIWQQQYLNQSHLLTAEGEKVDIVFPGVLNKNAGPDFLNAKIRIGNALLAGSVEVHLKTSDWDKHKHSLDPAYKNVVLHVVYEHDKQGMPTVPVLEIGDRISKIWLNRYEELMNNHQFIFCANSLLQVKELTWMSWKDRLLAERLTRKSAKLVTHLDQTRGHWEETLWQGLAHSLGGKVNGEVFEEIARSLPLTILGKHKNNLFQMEALLFGQANLLSGQSEDVYHQSLQKEYSFLQAKYGLNPVYSSLRFLRMRPQNFPTVRLAQLAMLIHQTTHLFSFLLQSDTVQEVKEAIAVTASDYWNTHYTFTKTSVSKPKKIGTHTLNHLFINTFVPLLFAYGTRLHAEEPKVKAIKWLETLPAEENWITKNFRFLSVNSRSAFDSQALIELKNEYCSQKRCLECAIGTALLKKEAIV